MQNAHPAWGLNIIRNPIWGEVGDGRFILSRRCVGVTPHLGISNVLLFHEGDPSFLDSALIKARVKKNRNDSGHWTNDCKTVQRCLGNPNTADVNNVIYWCHLEKIGPKGASFFASSLCYMWGDPLLCLFVLLSLGRRMGLYSGRLRVDLTQTVLLKLDFWYILNNNGFTRQEFFLSPSHNLFIFQKLKPDPQRGVRLFCYVCSERERKQARAVCLIALKHLYTGLREEEGEREREPALFTVWMLLHVLHVAERDGVRRLQQIRCCCQRI